MEKLEKFKERKNYLSTKIGALCGCKVCRRNYDEYERLEKVIKLIEGTTQSEDNKKKEKSIWDKW